jgi:hypothetical protein
MELAGLVFGRNGSGWNVFFEVDKKCAVTAESLIGHVFCGELSHCRVHKVPHKDEPIPCPCTLFS